MSAFHVIAPGLYGLTIACKKGNPPDTAVFREGAKLIVGARALTILSNCFIQIQIIVRLALQPFAISLEMRFQC